MNDFDEWPSKTDRDAATSRARELRKTAADGGLRFEVYLPPVLALWLMDRVERGQFLDPSEAAFTLFKQAEELEPHADLRHELLRRSLQAAMDDPHPGIPHSQVAEAMERWKTRPPSDPAVWESR